MQFVFTQNKSIANQFGARGKRGESGLDKQKFNNNREIKMRAENKHPQKEAYN